MKHKNVKLTNSSVEWTTNRNKDSGELRVASSLRYLTDPDKQERLKKAHECKSCFYFKSSRIGGAALTEWNCSVCNLEEMSGSTHCPKICRECSEKYELCCECGGDIHTRVRRKLELPE